MRIKIRIVELWSQYRFVCEFLILLKCSWKFNNVSWQCSFSNKISGQSRSKYRVNETAISAAKWRVNPSLCCDEFIVGLDFLTFRHVSSPRSQRSFACREKRSTPCIFNWSPIGGYICMYPLVPIDLFTCKSPDTYEPRLVFSMPRKSSLGSSKCIQDHAIASARNSSAWFTTSGKNLCMRARARVYVCVL